MSRCKHPKAFVKTVDGNMALIRCEDCGPLELWTPVTPWVSNHACRRVHRAPKWAQRLIDAHMQRDSLAVQDRSAIQPTGDT